MARGRRTGQAGGREGDVLEVASRHLNTMGVSVEWFGAIADELNVTRPALYNFAIDRGDMLFKCYARSCDALEAALQAATAEHRSPAEILDDFLTATGDESGLELAVLSELEALPEDKRATIIARSDAIAGRLARVVEQGVASGAFRRVDPPIVSHAILGMASWAPIHRRWAADRKLAPGAAGVKELLFRGLAASPDAPFRKLHGLLHQGADRIDLFDRSALLAARRDAILAAAAGLFNRRGIGATRIEDIGLAVGLSKRAVLHHFGSKDALIDACVARSHRLNLGVMEMAEELPCSRLEAIYAAVHEVIEAARNPDLSLLVLHVGFGLLSPTGRRAATANAGRLTEGYQRMLREGQQEGSVRDLPIEDVVQSLPGVFNWAARAAAPAFEGSSQVADELASLTIRGILA